MKIAKRSIRNLLAAWTRPWATRKETDAQAHAPTKEHPAALRHPGFGLIEIRPRDSGSGLQFPDNAALVRGVSDAVAKFPRGRVGTYFENALRNNIKPMIDHLGANGLGQARGDHRRMIETVRFLLARRAAGRYQDYFVRREMCGSELPSHVLIMSQGVESIMHWRGVPLVKTAFDVSLYMMMLWDLKPRTIIETGSASGGSATWMADLMVSYGLDCHVYSVDLRKPELSHTNVTFLEGDCNKIEEALPRNLLEHLPHPWLFVEDAHKNVTGVLEWIHTFTRPDDYVVVEDINSDAKQADIAPFMAAHASEYKVDTYYADFFGYNASCGSDCIWRRF
jgi:cephalosporin hydroxylase